MRAFIAIDVEEHVKKALIDLQHRLAVAVDVKKSDIKWVAPEAMHLTLKFLGETKDTEVVEICNIVKEVARRHKSFEFDIEKIGWFGNRSPKVFWAGIGNGSDKLGRLQEEVEFELALAGWPEEARKFNGHLTLCRIRNFKAGAKLATASEEYKYFEAGTSLADSVSVYQSQLEPSGPVYTVLGNYKLAK